MIFRFRYQQLGGHTHVRLFAGRSVAALGNTGGSFVLRNEEFAAFQTAFKDMLRQNGTVQFLEEGEDPGDLTGVA